MGDVFLPFLKESALTEDWKVAVFSFFEDPNFFTTHLLPSVSPLLALVHPVYHCFTVLFSPWFALFTTVSLSAGMVFVIETHVRSLATHYDEGSEDKNGATYSHRLAAKGVLTLSRVFHLVPPLTPPLVGRRRYLVLWLSQSYLCKDQTRCRTVVSGEMG
jgi:hypothetical protein